nr:MAG TPA: DNA helicase [Caudoviricetes sp.]
MTDITIIKRDELFVTLDASPSIWYELRDVFAFRPDGYKFMPAFKHGTWDGYIRLIDLRNRALYAGLIPELVKWAKEQGYSIAVDKSAGSLITQFDDVEQFLDNWSNVMKFEPYDYQANAVERAISLNKALILSPTGSGKSAIAHLIVRYLLAHTKYKILITVPTTQLVEQLCKDFADYMPDDTTFVEPHKVYGGREKYTDNRVVISTWQSMIKMPTDYFSQFDAYICDEAHQADGKSITKIIENLSATAKIRIGMTGTLDGTKCHAMQLRGLFGPIIKTQSTKELMDGGQLSGLKIQTHILRYKKKPATENDYQREIDYIVTNEARMQYVNSLAMQSTGNTLVLFNFVDKHGKPLYNSALGIAQQYDKEVFYISGETSIEQREVIREKFTTQNNVILFASFGTFSAGINAPNIHNLILAHPGKARIRTLQSIGRVLRKMQGKAHATLYDIGDDFSPKAKSKNHSYNHLLARLEIYEAERFDYSVKTVEFDNEQLCGQGSLA